MSEGKRAKGRTLAEFQTVDGWNDDKLYPAEKQLMACARAGEICYLGDERPAAPDPETNLVRAGFLRFLALGGDDETPLHERGLEIQGAWIGGEETSDSIKALDFEGSNIPANLIIWQSVIDGDLILRDCTVVTINLNGTILRKLHGDGLETVGSVLLRDGFTATGTVRLLSAKVSGVLSCDSATLSGNDISLNCDGLETTGGVFLSNGFTAAGAVRLLGARIGGDLTCRGGRCNGEGTSLQCQGAVIHGQGFLDGNDEIGRFSAHGTINLTDARFEKTLSFHGAILSSTESAIVAPGLRTGDRVSFNDAEIAGPVSITGARIGGDVTAEGARFDKGLALNRSTIDGILFWRGLEHFAGTLSLDQSRAAALSFDRDSWARPDTIRLDGFAYDRFHSLDPDCTGDFWTYEFLGPLRCFSQTEPALYWQPPAGEDAPRKRRPYRIIAAMARSLDGAGHPATFRPHAHGQLANVLQAMGHEEDARSVNIERRRLTVEAESARARNGAIAGRERLTLWWNRIAGLTIDHGYRPGRAFLWLIGIWLVWTVMFTGARHMGIITPTHPLIFKEAYGGMIPAECQRNWTAPPCTVPSEYSEFYAPAYSLDVLLPIIDLRQQVDWAPRVVHPDGSRDWWGWTVRFLEWVEIGLGWLLSLLLVSGVTGIIRRE